MPNAGLSGVEHVLVRDTADLLAGIGNSEAKAILFGAMALHGDGHPFSRGDTHELFLHVQGEQNMGWPDIASSVTRDYVTNSFEPVGAVTHSEVSTENGLYTRYFVNRYGQERGLGAVGLMLDLSLTHEKVALYGLVGGTLSRSEVGKRAPATRIKMLSLLAASKGQPVRIQDLRDYTESKLGAIEAQLAALKAVGAVEVSKRKRNEDERRLLVTDIDGFAAVKLRDRTGAITRDIHLFVTTKLIAGQNTVAVDELAKHLQVKHPNLTRKQIQQSITNIAARWGEKGIMRRQSDFTQETRSKITLRAEGEQLVDSYLLIVNALMEGDEDFLEWGKERALEIISDCEAVNLLLTKARRASPFKNSESRGAYANRILSLIEPGESVTIEEIVTRVQQQGKSSTSTSVGKILAMLVDDGCINRTDDNYKAYFSMIEEDKAGVLNIVQSD